MHHSLLGSKVPRAVNLHNKVEGWMVEIHQPMPKRDLDLGVEICSHPKAGHGLVHAHLRARQRRHSRRPQQRLGLAQAAHEFARMVDGMQGA
jgi:hypothetical protein